MSDKTLFEPEFIKKLEYLYLVSKKIVKGKQRNERRSKKLGSGIEFADYREYAPGDDIRHIDWNLYARLQRLFLRLFEEEEDLYIYLLLDVSNSMRLGNPSRLEFAKKVAAALAYIALNNLDRIGVITFAEKIISELPPSRGKRNIFKVLRFLENAIPETGQTALAESMRSFVHRYKRKGVVVLLSDFLDPKGYREAFNFLRYHKFEIYAIQLFDEREFTIELKGDFELIDSETAESLSLTLSPSIIREYRKKFEEYSRDLERFCKSREISIFRVSVRRPFEELVLNIFRRGGLVR